MLPPPRRQAASASGRQNQQAVLRASLEQRPRRRPHQHRAWYTVYAEGSSGFTDSQIRPVQQAPVSEPHTLEVPLWVTMRQHYASTTSALRQHYVSTTSVLEVSL